MSSKNRSLDNSAVYEPDNAPKVSPTTERSLTIITQQFRISANDGHETVVASLSSYNGETRSPRDIGAWLVSTTISTVKTSKTTIRG